MPDATPGLDRLIAAHLDDTLAEADALALHNHLRTDPEARRLLLGAARQAAALPRLALERATGHHASSVPPVSSTPVSAPLIRVPRWAMAAGLLLTVMAGLWYAAGRSSSDLRLDGTARIERAGTTHITTESSWLMAGDRVTTMDDTATLAWTREGTRLVMNPGGLVLVEATSGAKRLTLERGTVRAEVAHQTPSQGFTIITPFGAIAVVGTCFEVQVRDHDSHVTVESGAVQLVSGPGRTVVTLESGYTATMDGTKISAPMPQMPFPETPGFGPSPGLGGKTRLLHFGPADWRGGAGWEGDLVDGAIHGRMFEGKVTRIILPQRTDGYLPLSQDLTCTMRLTVDRETTCSLLLVCHGPDGHTWLKNLQGERRIPSGEQEIIWRLDELRFAIGSRNAMPTGSRITALAVMTWAPAADLRLHQFELRGSETTH